MLRTLDQLVGPADFAQGGGVDWRPRSKPLTERNGDVYLVAHHSVSRTQQAIRAEFHSPVRTLSATCGIGPTSPGVDDYKPFHAVPWNTGMPFTTSSSIDDKAFTFEMANLVLAYPWPVGDTGLEWFIEVAAAMHVELGMPLDRWHVTCHSEIYQRGLGSYATECCGTYMRGLLDWIVAQAIALVASGGESTPEPAPKGDDDMIIYIASSASADGVIRAGTSYISEGGPLRPLSRAEFEAHEYYCPRSGNPNSGKSQTALGYIVPTRWASWTGEAIRSATRYVGVMEQTGVAAGDVPILTGRVFYDSTTPTFPRVSIAVP